MEQSTERSAARRQWAAIGFLAVILAGSQALTDWRDSHGLLINTTESLPNWAFFVERKQVPKRGDFVVFAPPKSPIVVKHFGMDTAPFTKIAYGVPGDVVSRVGSDVAVNGKPVGRLKPATKRGEVLTPGPVGVIPDRCYYLGTPHKDGFDSRYADIGFVCADRIVGTGVPIL